MPSCLGVKYHHAIKWINHKWFTDFSRVPTNSKLGLFYSNFLILAPTFSKVSTEKYGKTPNFSGKQHFYSYFQNPSENSVLGKRFDVHNNIADIMTKL